MAASSRSSFLLSPLLPSSQTSPLRLFSHPYRHLSLTPFPSCQLRHASPTPTPTPKPAALQPGNILATFAETEQEGALLRTEREQEEGPVELPPAESFNYGELFAGEEITPLQTGASVLLTGAITFLLVRALRRRATRAKETKLRSQAVDRLNVALEGKKEAPPTLDRPLPSAFSTFSGALLAGAISYVLYTFTTGVEETFANQSVSGNYTIRNITIAVRTLVTGSGWLGTFVFGANSLGLALYATQIALGLAEDSSKGQKLPEASKEADVKQDKPTDS